jgi:hypothetical protein
VTLCVPISTFQIRNSRSAFQEARISTTLSLSALLHYYNNHAYLYASS